MQPESKNVKKKPKAPSDAMRSVPLAIEARAARILTRFAEVTESTIADELALLMAKLRPTIDRHVQDRAEFLERFDARLVEQHKQIVRELQSVTEIPHTHADAPAPHFETYRSAAAPDPDPLIG